MLTSSGFFCECCGACSDTMCIQLADKVLICKNKYAEEVSYAENTKEPIVAPQKHLWVKGNLPLNCVCTVCERDIDYHGKPGLYGYRCCWCQRATHTNCFPRTVDDKVSYLMSSDFCQSVSIFNVFPPFSIDMWFWSIQRLHHTTE